MIEVIKEYIRVAKKDHRDDSAEWIQNGLLDHRPIGEGLSFTDWRCIAQLKAKGWKIKKGQTYIEQHNKQDGKIYVFRTLPEILKICIKHKLYVE